MHCLQDRRWDHRLGVVEGRLGWLVEAAPPQTVDVRVGLCRL